jgi:hypothetical protein
VRKIQLEKRKPATAPVLLIILLMTAGALFVHGYHPFVEDAEIYLPGVERILNPQLFPMGREFFEAHAHMTLFPNFVALLVRVAHVPLDVVLFIAQVASIFLLLLACWELASLCFSSRTARWAAVAMVAALLTMPVAGTALYIMDQYLNPRNLAAFATVFAVARTLEAKYLRALFWLVFAALMHPLMWTYAFSFCVLLVAMKWREHRSAEKLARAQVPAGIAGLLLMIPLNPKTTPAYHEAAKAHAYHYIQSWAWYEILGLLAPIVLFWWFDRIAQKQDWKNVQRLCRAFIVYDVIYTIAALVVDLPARFESLARLQPLRCLHLLYIVMLLMIGGLLGEFVLKNRVWRWIVLFVPLSLGMFVAQRALFPASATVEWPGRAAKNPWAQAFLWIRQNTPIDAVFALDPHYMHIDDEVGFRCLAERSRMADAVKDNGVVSMFPSLAEEWWAQVQAQSPWQTLTLENFDQLKRRYEVGWVVVQQPGVVGMACPYENSAVKVCQIR